MKAGRSESDSKERNCPAFPEVEAVKIWVNRLAKKGESPEVGRIYLTDGKEMAYQALSGVLFQVPSEYPHLYLEQPHSAELVGGSNQNLNELVTRRSVSGWLRNRKVRMIMA